jgi:hypothetical protein
MRFQVPATAPPKKKKIMKEKYKLSQIKIKEICHH